MYAYVRNIFKEKDQNGNVPLFIKIDTVEDMDLYEFFQKLQLLKGENPYDVNTGISLEAIQNNQLTEINTEIANLINQYSFLGTIEFEITSNQYSIEVTIRMVLNKKFSGSNYLVKTLSIGAING